MCFRDYIDRIILPSFNDEIGRYFGLLNFVYHIRINCIFHGIYGQFHLLVTSTIDHISTIYFKVGVRTNSSEIDKALNEVNNGKTIHRLSVEYNLPRSTLYHRFRNNEHLKQNYRLERKSALDSAVQAVLNERLSLKTAADRYKVPKTAIWREVRKCEQYQPTTKGITEERQNAQREILSGKSLTSISAKYGKNIQFVPNALPL